MFEELLDELSGRHATWEDFFGIARVNPTFKRAEQMVRRGELTQEQAILRAALFVAAKTDSMADTVARLRVLSRPESFIIPTELFDEQCSNYPTARSEWLHQFPGDAK